MKTTRTVALLAAAFILLFSSGAKAQEKFGPMYFGVSGGVYAPEGTELDADDAKTGFVGLVNFGYMFNPFFGLQSDFGYFQTSGDHDMKVAAIPVAFSLKLAVPIAFVEPYVLGGGGVYFCQTEYAGFDDNTTEFAAHAAGGVNFNFGRFQLGAEARYVWLEAANNINADGMMVMGKIGSRF